MAINADVQARYEARIDELFAGEEPRFHSGVTVLVRADVLDMLGYGDQPVILAEVKVRKSYDNHPEMTAEIWKKIPQWLENPAMVFVSDTNPDRLVFIAPEKIGDNTVRLIIAEELDNQGNRHLLLNAYSSEKSPFGRWLEDRLLLYADTKEAPRILGKYARRLRHVLEDPAFRPNARINGTGRGKQKALGLGTILTEKKLEGYRKRTQHVEVSLPQQEQDPRTEKIQLAKSLHGRYLDTTRLTAERKEAEKKRLDAVIKTTPLERIERFIGMLRSELRKAQEKTKTKNIGKNRSGSIER